MKETQKPKIIFIPYPAQGHVTPMLHLASAFLSRGFSPVVMTPESIHRRISTTNDDLGITFLAISDGQEHPDAPPSDFFSIEKSMENIMPSQLERILLQEDMGVACVVVDLLASWAIRVADQCGVPVAGFWPVMFAAYRMIEAIPELVRTGIVSRKDAAWNSSTCAGGLGWICLKPDGTTLVQGSASTEVVASVLVAEALAMKAAMEAAIGNEVRDLICFSDSKSLISLITGNKSVVALQGILHDICVLSLSLKSISFKFVNRSCNVAADQLAKDALFKMQNSVSAM